MEAITVESGNPIYDSRENCNAIIETATNTLIIGCENSVVPNSVTSIKYSAFYSCSGLIFVKIPQSVNYVGTWAYAYCNSLDSVIWEARNCQDLSLSNYNVKEDIYQEGYIGIFPSSVTSFDLGNEVEYIPANLCYRLCNLSSIDIPQNVKNIGKSAFAYCSGLTSVTIPYSISSIGYEAFY